MARRDKHLEFIDRVGGLELDILLDAEEEVSV
jgi:hypothetical protein